MQRPGESRQEWQAQLGSNQHIWLWRVYSPNIEIEQCEIQQRRGSQGTVLCKEAIVDLSSKQYKLKKQCPDPLGAIDAVFHEARGEQHSLDILVRCLGNPYNSVSQLS